MSSALDQAAARSWVEAIAGPVAGFEVVKERPWATVARVDRAAGPAWFKACQPVQAYEPRLTADLAARWPDRMPLVLGTDEERGWLLTADAGAAVGTLGNPPELWLAALPRYAELQIGEAAHVEEHLAHGVPDLRLATLPAALDRLLASEVPLDPADARRLRGATGRFAAMCRDLAGAAIPASVQHDDLHVNGLLVRGGEMRFVDWGDASIGHPWFSLVTTFRFLEVHNGLDPSDPWFDRLRDAYLEPFGGPRLREPFAMAFRVGVLAHCFAWHRHRDAMPPEASELFDPHYADLLRWATDRALGTA